MQFTCLICGEQYTKEDRHHCLDRANPTSDHPAYMRSEAKVSKKKKEPREWDYLPPSAHSE